MTGGAPVAGEALLSGGLTGLEASRESIQAGAIGGGVGTAVNNAVDGGEFGHVISGIAGGVAKTIRGRARARRPITEEQQPLISSGERLGGNSMGRSRSVEPEIQLTHDH